MYRLLRPAVNSLVKPGRYFQGPGVRTLASFTPSTPNVEVSTLPNGLRVATEATPGEMATVGFWIDSGSAAETDQNNGVAHFLEHMVFRGTQSKTRRQIELDVETRGATLNAYTSREHTVYYGQCFRQDVGFTVDMLSDILLNPKLDPSAIENERGTILREKEEVENIFEEYMHDQMHAAAFQRGPLARTILGTDANINSISRDQLLDYIKTHYTGNRIVVVGSGAVDHEALVKDAEKNFGHLANVKYEHQQSPYTGTMVTREDPNAHETHISIGVHTPGHAHPDNMVFQLLTYLIGQWNISEGGASNTASRLGEVYSEEKLGYAVKPFNVTYHHNGLFGITAIADPHCNPEAVYELCNEMQRLARHVTDRELQRAKNQAKANYLYSLDSSFARAEDVGRHLLNFDRHVPPAEFFARIDRITGNDIKRVAYEYFHDACPSVVVVGNLEGLPDYGQIRGWMYWNRI